MEEKLIMLHTKPRLVEVKFRNTEKSTDILYEDRFEFHSHKLYGLHGSYGEGGWAISSLLSGRTKIEDEEISINELEYCRHEFVNKGWYVGEGLESKNIFTKDLSVRKQIEKALKISKLNYSVNDIVDLFELTSERLKCKFSKLSWESWRVSVAIGYSLNKIIYCFPWLGTSDLKNVLMNTGFMLYKDILINSGAIIIIPTSDLEILNLITPNIITLKNPSFHNYEYLREYIKNNQINSF